MVARRRQRAVTALRAAWATVGPTAQELVTRRHPVTPGSGFVPLPAPSGQPPYRRSLAEIVGRGPIAEIARDGALRFHCVGDTGGHGDPLAQARVMAAMAAELSGAAPPRFFYHLGDVVYPHGEEAHYRSQFFAANEPYTAPILGVPGNHDAENDLSGELALAPFLATFGSNALPLHEAGATVRPPSRQPHVYWTLVHDWLRIVGVYSNVPEGGQFDDEQLRWLIGELQATPEHATLILAMHQPPISADITHGSNLTLAELLDDCAAQAGRGPDAVFGGHAHSYQRFTRRGADGRPIPHIVAGAGGYPELHPLGRGVGALPASFRGLDGVTLDAYEDRAHGFMTVTAGPGGADVAYTTVGARGVARADAFRITPPDST